MATKNSNLLHSDLKNFIAGADDVYSDYVRPYVGRLLKLLKLDKTYTRAAGDFLYFLSEKNPAQEVAVLDLLGGYGSTLVGHNHPELTETMKEILEAGTPVHSQASIRMYSSLLARKLSDKLKTETAREENWVTTLCNSGAEAAEAGIKHSLMEWQARQSDLLFRLRQIRAQLKTKPDSTAELQALEEFITKTELLEPVVLAVDGSFHGKTAGSVSVTTNLAFRGMYPSSPCKVVFLKRESPITEMEQVFSGQDWYLPPQLQLGQVFSRVAGLIYEGIQGEGGIQVLPSEFCKTIAQQTKIRNIPLIADEIQSGLYRTGKFLASSHLDLVPDYVLLGKGLGGGLVKVASLSVVKSRYQEKFGFIHTSTFAEDDLSSAVALKTIEFLSSKKEEIAERAETFEAAIREKVKSLQVSYPGILNEVRGKGFLLGIEFNFQETAPLTTLLETIYQAGFATYIYTSYLLHKHQLRVGVTLSKPDTLRIEPSAFISAENRNRFLSGIEDLCQLIQERKFLQLTAHFWRQEFSAKQLELASPLRVVPKKKSTLRKIGFFVHLIDDAHLCLLDPMLRALKREERDRFQAKFGPTTGPLKFHEQVIQGANGSEVLLHCYGVFLPSTYFEKSLRANDGAAYSQVEAMMERAAKEKMQMVGLGQYTSIVSANGLMLDRFGVPLTTGNSLTAFMAFQALEKALQEKGKTLEEACIGIVGAAGNICNVLTQLIGDRAREVTLVFREALEQDPKAQRALQLIQANTKISPSKISATTDFQALLNCDAIVLGTNSAQQLLLSQHLQKNAVVLDISVPSNVHPQVRTERPDVRCIQGGMAKLPLGQKIESPWFPVAPGDVFACMGETICAGLLNYHDHLSIGPLAKKRVLEVGQMAAQVGMSLGAMREIYDFQ